MKKPKYFQPEKDFSFAEEIFTLRGEVVTVGEAPKEKAKDSTMELFKAELFAEMGGE